jgi:hypothetical protein
MSPWRITLTGVDAGCPLEELLHLSHQTSGLEWALLYSRERAGTGRYPSAEWISHCAEGLKRDGHAVALHVCGTAVAHLLNTGALPELRTLSSFSRVQLNGNITDENAGNLQRLIENAPLTLITQYDQNPRLPQLVNRPLQHQLLFDASGGRGILRDAWPTPLAGFDFGYAGGLSPENLPMQMARITRAAGAHRFWVDMETSLRTPDNRFCPDRARLALTAIKSSRPA